MVSENTRATVLPVSPAVAAALEGLGPELRNILLQPATRSSSEQLFSETDDDTQDNAAIVSRFVQHVVNQEGVDQQEATLRAAQHLEATEHHMDERLHSEVVFCHEQLLSTVAASEHLHSKLSTLDTNITALQNATRRMKLCVGVPLAQLRSRVLAMERYQQLLDLVATLKRLVRLSKSFEAQYGFLGDTALDKALPLLDLPKAALAQHDILRTLERFAHLCGIGDARQGTVDDAALKARFPVLRQDIIRIIDRGETLRRLATTMLQEGLDGLDQSRLLSGLETLLLYGGLPLGISVVQEILVKMFRKTTLETETITNGLRSGYPARPRHQGTQQERSSTQSSPVQALLSSLGAFLDMLQMNTKRTCALSSILTTLGRNPDFRAQVGLPDPVTTSQGRQTDLCSSFTISLGYVRSDGTPLDDLPLILWHEALKSLGTTISRLSATSASFHTLLVDNCPSVLRLISTAGTEMTMLWATHQRMCQLLSRDASFPMSHNQFDINVDKTSPVSDGLDSIFHPFAEDYIHDVRTSLISPAKLMFPTPSAYGRTVTLPTTADIKTFVATLSTELTHAAASQRLQSNVVSVAEETLLLCCTSLKDLRDPTAFMLPLATDATTGELKGPLPTATLGYSRNAKLHEVCSLLYNGVASLLSIPSLEASTVRHDRTGVPTETRLTDLELPPAYAPLREALQFLHTIKESLVSGWFESLEHLISAQLCLLASQPAMGETFLRRITSMFLAATCFVTSMDHVAQRTQLVAYAETFETTLVQLCPKLSEHLAAEHLMMKALCRLITLDMEHHLKPPSPEFLSVTQLLPRHVLCLHLLSRLPHTVSPLSTFLGVSVQELVPQVAQSLRPTAQETADVATSPSGICDALRRLLNDPAWRTTIAERDPGGHVVLEFLEEELAMHRCRSP